jgi:antibiotic biosynthesis monooxygenase (ABM) superfamily enzyme
MVSVLTWVIVPTLVRLFRPWLFAAAARQLPPAQVPRAGRA